MVEASNRGRPSSWIAVCTIIVGFIVGGIAFAAAVWWLVAVATAVVLVGGIYGLATGIMNDVH